MKRYIGIAALSLVLVFGVSMSSAFAIGSPNPEELLLEQEAEMAALSAFEKNEVELQYRVLEPELELEISFEEVIESVGAAGE